MHITKNIVTCNVINKKNENVVELTFYVVNREANGCCLGWFPLTNVSPLPHLAGIKVQQRPGRPSKVG